MPIKKYEPEQIVTRILVQNSDTIRTKEKGGNMENGRYGEEQVMTVSKQMEAGRNGVPRQSSKRTENRLTCNCR
jgi:hypothetical protein